MTNNIFEPMRSGLPPLVAGQCIQRSIVPATLPPDLPSKPWLRVAVLVAMGYSLSRAAEALDISRPEAVRLMQQSWGITGHSFAVLRRIVNDAPAGTPKEIGTLIVARVRLARCYQFLDQFGPEAGAA